MRTATKVLLAFLLAGLAVEVVVLSLQKREQRRMIDGLLEGQANEAPAVSAGDRLPVDGMVLLPIEENAFLTREVRFAAEEPCRLIFLFNTHCPLCKETAPTWRRLAEGMAEVRGEDAAGPVVGPVEVMAIANDAPEEIAAYRKTTDFGAPVYRLESAPYSEVLGVRFVPHTFLLSPQGVVLGIWPQALDDGAVDQIRNLIGVSCSDPDAIPNRPSASAERKEVS